ncbi:MAG: hypothetical protein RBT62_04280 [Spirochaetia bacterium]|nr:hypothetical protein [Spirochaetia bacterium]
MIRSLIKAARLHNKAFSIPEAIFQDNDTGIVVTPGFVTMTF